MECKRLQAAALRLWKHCCLPGVISAGAIIALAPLALAQDTAHNPSPLTGGVRYAQPSYNGGASGPWVRPVNYQAPCPCEPCQPGVSAPSTEPTDDNNIPVPGSEAETLPEVADLAPDAGFAGGPQSAVPNAIGDSLSYGGCGVFHDD
ncbi:MAG: hypothetical protein KDA41_04375, partial [Planctomycetales bacterium]|nr:hypothetical protein [Planctomycetales bacterium]